MIYESVIRNYNNKFELPTQLNIMREYYENEISFLKMSINYKESINESTELESIHEGYMDTIKKKIKEIIQKFINFIKNIINKIKEKINKNRDTMVIYNKKYEKLFNYKIKPILKKEKNFNTALEQIIPILRQNGFIREPNDNVKKETKSGLYSIKFDNGNIINLNIYMEKLSHRIIAKTDKTISDIKTCVDSWHTIFNDTIHEIEQLEENINKNFENISYESNEINDEYKLSPSMVNNVHELEMVEKWNNDYIKTLNDFEKAVNHLEKNIGAELRKGVSEEEASKLTNTLNRVISLYNTITTKYTQYMAKVNSKKLLDWHFYVVEY